MAWTTKKTLYFCVVFVVCRSCLGEKKCVWSCIGKSCTKDQNCGIGEMCCRHNSSIGHCARSCTVGKWCTSDVSCKSGEFCCLNETGGRQCARSCTVEKSCITNHDCAPNERCCGSDVKKCTRNCLPNKELCLTDQDCSSGQCCDNGSCTKECNKNTREWLAAYAALICILFFICFLIGFCKCRCRKARGAEAPRQTIHGGVKHRVTRGTIDLENQLRQQYYAEQQPSQPNSYPNYFPSSNQNQGPPAYDQPLPGNQSIYPTQNQPPTPYTGQPPPPYPA